ncbi:MAG: hypothetical protein U1E65_31685 [Myxococcota bacterium]
MSERDDQQLVDYLYDELSEKEAAAFEERLRADPARAEEVDELSLALTTLREADLEEEPAPRLNGLILAHARQVAEAEAARPRGWRKLFAGTSLGMLVAGVAAVVVAIVSVPALKQSPDLDEASRVAFQAKSNPAPEAAPPAPAVQAAPTPVELAAPKNEAKLAEREPAPEADRLDQTAEPRRAAPAKAGQLRLADEDAPAPAAHGAPAGTVGSRGLAEKAAEPAQGYAIGGEGGGGRAKDVARRESKKLEAATEQAPDDSVRATAGDDKGGLEDGRRRSAASGAGDSAGLGTLGGAVAAKADEPKYRPQAKEESESVEVAKSAERSTRSPPKAPAPAPATAAAGPGAAAPAEAASAPVLPEPKPAPPAPPADPTGKKAKAASDVDADAVAGNAIARAEKAIAQQKLDEARAILKAARAQIPGTKACGQVMLRLAKLELADRHYALARSYATEAEGYDPRLRLEAQRVVREANLQDAPH